MKTLYLLITIAAVFFHTIAVSQTLDTLIDVGTHNLHFRIDPGNGMPIVFESGAGNDGTVWREVMSLLRKQTDAPLIAYDRAGFGKSEIDTIHVNISSEVKDLQIGLQKLDVSSDYFFCTLSRRKLRDEIYLR